MYATGEILLIIIGIFLALQINNSYSEKRERKEFESALLFVLEDLEKDKSNLLFQQKMRELTIEQNQFILKAVAEGRSLESLELISNLGVFSYIKTERSENGFESLLSANLYESIEFAMVREKIRAYIQGFNSYLEVEKKTNDFIEEMEVDMFKAGSNLEYLEYTYLRDLSLRNPEEEIKAIITDYKIDFDRLVTNNPPMLAVLRRSLVLHQILNDRSTAQIEAGEEVIIEIEKYVKNKK